MFAFTGLESKPTISPIGNTNEKTTELPINPQPQSPPVEDLQQIPSYSAERPQPDNQISFCTIGNSIQNTIWKIDFIDAGLYDKIGDSPFQDTPKAGNQFLALFFEIENLSTTESYFNAYYFDCYIDGYVIDPALTLNDVEGYGTLFANIKPSKKHKGCLIFEVSKDWEKLEISYDDDFGGSEMYFEVSKTDL